MTAPNTKNSNGNEPASAVTAVGGRDLDTKSNAMSRPTGQRFGPGMMAGGPAAKAMDFKNSSRRLLRMMTPQRGLLYTLLGLGVISVTLSVIGPKILAHATDLIVAGWLGGRFPAGTSKTQAVAGVRAQGGDRAAKFANSVDFTPGQGIDFTAIGKVLLVVLVLYVLASIFMYVQGRLVTVVVQRTVFSMREQVEAKLSRLPLVYFDRQPRGELLSRVTNDIDNIAQTLQQSMSQLLTSALTDDRRACADVRDLAAARGDRADHGAVVGVRRDPDRQEGAAAVHPAVVDDRQTQRPHRGDVHRALAGQGVRAPGGVGGDLRAAQHETVQRRVPSAVRVRHDPAGHGLHRQHQLRVRRGRRRVAGVLGRAVDR